MRWVRLFGLEDRRELEKVFVDLTILEDYRRPRFHAEFLGMMDAEMRRRRSLFEWRDDDAEQQRPGDKKEKRTVKPDELLSRRTRTVITGAPGCGKTTLLRYLAFRTLNENQHLPIFLELKTITKSQLEKSGDLTDLLFEKAIPGQTRMNGGRRKPLKQHFTESLDAGRAAIFLDGLDEIGEEAFTGLCNAVNEFVGSTHRDNLVIISTGPYALRTRLEGMEQMEIAPLTQRQVEEFINHYYGGDSSSGRFLKEIRRRGELRELTQSPLLLGAMIALFRDRNRMIDDRLELYRQMAAQLAVQLDREKGVKRFHLVDPEGSLKIDFLKELACDRLLIDEVKRDESTKSHEEARSGGEAARLVFTGDLILAKAKSFVERTGRPEINPHLLAVDVKATPLLREVGADTYAFSHLTLQEYMAAWALARRPDCDTILCLAYFNTTIVEMEVSPMALGLVADTRVLYTKIEGLPESLTFAGSRLCARGLGYGANPGVEVVKSLTRRLLDFIAGRDPEEDVYREIVVRDYSVAARRLFDDIGSHVLSLLKYKNPDVRWRAADAVGQIGSEHAVDALLSALKDQDRNVRWSAAGALGKIGSERAVDALLAALKDQHRVVRWSAAAALGKIGSERAVDALLAALKDQHRDVRWSAAAALGKIGSDHAVDALLSALKDERRDVRWSAAAALGNIAIERAVDPLLSALKDQDRNVRRSAAAALGQIGSERAVDALLAAVKDQDSFVRWTAAGALGKIGSERAVDALLSSLKDQDSDVRWNAAAAFEPIPDGALLNGLRLAMCGKTTFSRIKAVGAIGYYSESRELLDELSRIGRDDPAEEVRAAAIDERERFVRKLEILERESDAVATRREAFIRAKYEEVQRLTNSAEKGKALEELLAALIASIDGFIESGRNVITADEEIDIVFRNESRDPFWERHSALTLVECKDWHSKRVGKNEFVLFHAKMQNRYALCKLGFLVCTEDFAETIEKEMLRGSRGDLLVVPINGKRLAELVESSDRNELLKCYVTDAALL